jgi:hypothetical protein
MKINKLKKVSNFAAQEGVTPTYIYRLVREMKIEIIMIDGVQFIDTERFPGIPSDIKRRNR